MDGLGTYPVEDDVAFMGYTTLEIDKDAAIEIA